MLITVIVGKARDQSGLIEIDTSDTRVLGEIYCIVAGDRSTPTVSNNDDLFPQAVCSNNQIF